MGRICHKKTLARWKRSIDPDSKKNWPTSCGFWHVSAGQEWRTKTSLEFKQTFGTTVVQVIGFFRGATYGFKISYLYRKAKWKPETQRVLLPVGLFLCQKWQHWRSWTTKQLHFSGVPPKYQKLQENEVSFNILLSNAALPIFAPPFYFKGRSVTSVLGVYMMCPKVPLLRKNTTTGPIKTAGLKNFSDAFRFSFW